MAAYNQTPVQRLGGPGQNWQNVGNGSMPVTSGINQAPLLRRPMDQVHGSAGMQPVTDGNASMLGGQMPVFSQGAAYGPSQNMGAQQAAILNPPLNQAHNQSAYTSPQQQSQGAYNNQANRFNYSPNNNSMAMPYGTPQTGLIGAEQAMYAGANQASRGVNRNIGAGVGNFSPYIKQGQNANNYQSALSGAMGSAAQQKAYDDFIDSPGQAWLREKGERAVTRNASALGGLGGGRVMQELQRQGQGLAAQDFDASFNRLGSISDRGMMGASGAANLYGQGANLQSQIGMNTGTNIANNRMQAGRDIASGVQGTTSSLADLINNQGSGISDMTGANGSNLAQMLSYLGSENGLSMQQLSQLLSGQGLSNAGQWGGQGIGQGGESQGNMQNWGALLGGVASAGSDFGWW